MRWRPWTAKEKSLLVANPHEAVADLAARLGRTPGSVRNAQKRLGLVETRVKRSLRKRNPPDPGAYLIPAYAATHDGLDDEQEAWLKIIAAFRQSNRRPPTLLEAFRLAKEMGYAKVAEATRLPKVRQQRGT